MRVQAAFQVLLISLVLLEVCNGWSRRRRRKVRCVASNCRYRKWSRDGKCSRTCGGGVQKWKRQPVNCANVCKKTTKETKCNTKCCPTRCKLSSWTSYTACTGKCGGSGIQTRLRYKLRPEYCGGSCPFHLTEARSCRTKCCPTKCQVSSWSSYGRCSATCGTTGIQTRTRQKTRRESCGGHCPYALKEERECNRKCCPVKCKVSAWSSYGKCSSTCGTSGIQIRTRKKITKEVCGGKCDFTLKEERKCNRKCCSVDCKRAWSSWTPCNCVGKQKRTWAIVRPAYCGGKRCSTRVVQHRGCSPKNRCGRGWCQKLTGRCICHPGYLGRFCNIPCPQGKYGRECHKKCKCDRGFCHHIDGKCTCPVGYTGRRCDMKYKCADNKYRCAATIVPYFRRRNCVVRYTFLSSTTPCPAKTHYAAGCSAKPRCRARRTRGARGCIWQCRSTFSMALCCPRKPYLP